jgi:hypothetical protein
MWLYIIALVLLVVGLVGGVLTGGIFLIVFIPLGVLMAVTAAAVAAFGRASQRAGGSDMDARPSTNQPLPHTPESDSGRVPSSPEALAEARRVQQ